MRGIAGEMQHAAGIGADRKTARRQVSDVSPAIQAAGTCEPAHAVVVEAGQRPQHACQVAGSAGRGSSGGIDQFDGPAACGKPFGQRAAGQPCADHQRMA